MNTAAATIEIGASPEAACAVLTGPGRCQEWNPLFPGAFGQVAAGRTLARAEAGFGMLHGPSTGGHREDGGI
jgi:hypothetical protein